MRVGGTGSWSRRHPVLALTCLVALTGCTSFNPRAAEILRAYGFPTASPPCATALERHEDASAPRDALPTSYTASFNEALDKQWRPKKALTRALEPVASRYPVYVARYLVTGFAPGTRFRTLLKLVLATDGRLEGLEIECTSGIPEFDAELVRALRAAALPPPPAERLDEHGRLEIMLSVTLAKD